MREVLPHAPHPTVVLSLHVHRHRIAPLGGLVPYLEPREAAEELARARGGDLLFRLDVHGYRVACEDRDANGRGRDHEIRRLEDLARLVDQLPLLARVTVRRERVDGGNQVERDAMREVPRHHRLAARPGQRLLPQVVDPIDAGAPPAIRMSSPRKLTVLPTERSEAKARSSRTGNLRSSRILSVVCPAAPVAPTTAMVTPEAISPPARARRDRSSRVSRAPSRPAWRCRPSAGPARARAGPRPRPRPPRPSCSESTAAAGRPTKWRRAGWRRPCRRCPAPCRGPARRARRCDRPRPRGPATPTAACPSIPPGWPPRPTGCRRTCSR